MVVIAKTLICWIAGAHQKAVMMMVILMMIINDDDANVGVLKRLSKNCLGALFFCFYLSRPFDPLSFDIKRAH